MFINYQLEYFTAQFYRFSENIQVNKTKKEYDMKYLVKLNIYKKIYNYDK